MILLELFSTLKDYKLFFEKTPSHASIPPYQNGTMAKDAESVRTVRRERGLCVVCTAGAFIGCVDNVKSE